MSFTSFIFNLTEKLFDGKVNDRKLEKQLADVECLQNIVYSPESQMMLDLYFLPNQERYPVIFEIHGGGFAGGDKKYRRCLCRMLAKQTKALVVNVNYGTGAQSVCPIPMQQLAEAVNWVADNAEKYNMDLSKFVVTGDSAGAYYACFLAALQDSEYLQNLFKCNINSRITATVLNCGVYDMKYALKHKMLLNQGVSKSLTGFRVSKAQKSVYFEGLTLTTHMTVHFPATLLICSNHDWICPGQGKLMSEKLESLGVPTQTVCSNALRDNHIFCLWSKSKMARQANAEILAFLCNHFESA